MRLALGAGRARIVRQLLTESVTLSMAGGILGNRSGILERASAAGIFGSTSTRPLGISAEIDMRVLAFTIGVSLLTGIIFGLAPALRSMRVDMTPALKEGAGKGSSAGTRDDSELAQGSAGGGASCADGCGPGGGGAVGTHAGEFGKHRSRIRDAKRSEFRSGFDSDRLQGRATCRHFITNCATVRRNSRSAFRELFVDHVAERIALHKGFHLPGNPPSEGATRITSRWGRIFSRRWGSGSCLAGISLPLNSCIGRASGRRWHAVPRLQRS